MYHTRKKIQLHVSMEDIQLSGNWGCRGEYMTITIVEGTLFNLFQAIYFQADKLYFGKVELGFTEILSGMGNVQ